MPPLDRKVKDTCANCRNSVTNQKPSRHKARCSAGTLYCANCPNFSTKSGDDLNCHIAKKHATPRVKVTNKCKICFRGFFWPLCVARTKNKRAGNSDKIS